MRRVLLVAVTMALVGCAAAPPVSPVPGSVSVPAERRPLVSEVYRYKTLVGYDWNGKVYADSGQLHHAIDESIAQDRARLPRLAASGAAVKVLRPNPRAVSGVAPVANLRLAEARIEALRDSGLFSAVRVENDAPGKFVAQGGDYVLRLDDRGVWTLLDGEERRTAIGNGADLADFVATVAAGVETLRRDSAYIHVLDAAQGSGGTDVVLYRDRQYRDLVSLIDGFDRVNAELTGQVVPAAKPLGGRALLVLPRRAADVSALRPGERPGLIDSARKAYRQALDRRFARFVAAARLFSEVRVEYADALGQIPLDYDWVLWRENNDPAWSGRSRDVAFGALPLSTRPAGFAAALAWALTLPADLPPEAVADVPALTRVRVDGVEFFDWQGRRHAGEDELLRAAQSRLADEVAAVAPLPASGRTLRVVLPPPSAADGVAGRFGHRLDQARLDGLRKSGLVGDFAVETGFVRDPDVDGHDFVLYRTADCWRIKDARGRMLRLLVAPTVAGFVGHVERALRDLSGELDYLDALPVQGGVVYSFMGREYGGLRGLLAALEQRLREEERQMVAVPPVAGRALVVLPLDSTAEPGLRKMLTDSGAWAPAVAGFDAFQRFQDRRVGAFVAASGLFSSVRVVTAAGAEPEPGDHDWVMWRRPGQPLWTLRARGEAPFNAALPAKPEGFALDLRALMTARR